MANWCNIRLSVFGPREVVLPFRRDAGHGKKGIDTSRSTVFLPEMEVGEGGDLRAHDPETFGRRFQRLEYTFQGRNDDYAEHFTEVSGRYPGLAFVLTFGDPNADSHGSYLLLAGRRRAWAVPRRIQQELMRKHYRRWKLVDRRGRLDYDADDSDMAEWDAYFEMMDVAAAHWDAQVLAWLRAQYPPRRGAVKGVKRRQRE